MGIEENKEVVRRFQERLDRGDVSVIDELMTDNCIFHATDMGIDSFKEDIKQRQGSRALSEQTITILDMIAEGDKVFARCVRKAKHTGKSGLFPNISPTGKETSVSHFVLYRLEGGKIAEAWTLMNWLGLFQQIGALPPTEEIRK